METSGEIEIRVSGSGDEAEVRRILQGAPEAAQWFGMADSLVALRDGRVVGFVAYRVVLDEGEILNLAVEAAARRQGVAAALLGAVRPLAAEWFLEVRESNVGARSLYERLGFALCGRRTRYYSDGEDATLYRWP